MIVLFALAAAAALPGVSPPDALATRALHKFGACIAERSPRGARELLAMDFGTEDYRKKLRALAKGNDRCIAPGWSLAANRMLIAGAIAEAMLESEIKPAELPQRLAYDPARPAIPARSPTEAMALCTVLNAPQASVRVLAVEPATKEETAAMQGIGPMLVDCLKKDMKVELNKPALRSLLALAAWRIASTPKAAAK